MKPVVLRASIAVISALVVSLALTAVLLWDRQLRTETRAMPWAETASHPQDERAVWQRENNYFNVAQTERRPSTEETGAPILEQIPTVWSDNPNRIEVLAVGDSNTYGWGVPDTDMLWPATLQAELDKRTAPGTFRVRTLASPGSSTWEHARWLEDHIAALNPDIVILGYNSNDVFPQEVTSVIPSCTLENCPAGYIEMHPLFRECAVDPNDDILSGVSRQVGGVECTIEGLKRELQAPTIQEILRGEAPYPYATEQQAVAQQLYRALEGRPGLLLTTAVGRLDLEFSAPYRQALIDAGLIDVPLTSTSATIERHTDSQHPDMHANLVDQHPGPLLTWAYAADAATAILDTIAPARLEKARATAEAPQRLLLSNHLPLDIELAPHTDTSVRVSTLTANDHTGAGEPPQFTPCADMNRPHLRIMLQPGRRSDQTLTVKVSEGDPSVAIYAIGYSPQGQRFSIHLGNAEPGEFISVTDRDVRGLLISRADTPEGCPIDRVLEVPKLAVTVEVA